MVKLHSLRSVERVKIQKHMKSQGKNCLTWSEFSFCQILSRKYLLKATEAYSTSLLAHIFFWNWIAMAFPMRAAAMSLMWEKGEFSTLV